MIGNNFFAEEIKYIRVKFLIDRYIFTHNRQLVQLIWHLVTVNDCDRSRTRNMAIIFTFLWCCECRLYRRAKTLLCVILDAIVLLKPR